MAFLEQVALKDWLGATHIYGGMLQDLVSNRLVLIYDAVR